MPESNEPQKPARAGFNQFFVCTVCAKAFADRAAKEPIEVSAETALVPRTVLHAKHPEIAELSRTELDRKVIDGGAKVPAREASACCATHATLADSRYFTITKRGTSFEITAAKYLE